MGLDFVPYGLADALTDVLRPGNFNGLVQFSRGWLSRVGGTEAHTSLWVLSPCSRVSTSLKGLSDHQAPEHSSASSCKHTLSGVNAPIY